MHKLTSLQPSKSAGTVLLSVVTKKATLPCQCLVIKEQSYFVPQVFTILNTDIIH